MSDTREHLYPEVELQSADKHGSGSFSCNYFKIEVRTSDRSPIVISLEGEREPFVIDHCWRNWPVYPGVTKWGINIPIRTWDAEAMQYGIMPYVAAEAHRWAFLAALEAARAGGTICVETRLVEVKFKKTYSMEEVGVTPALQSGWQSPKDVKPRFPKVAT